MSAALRRFAWLLGDGPPPPPPSRPELALTARAALTWWRVLPLTAPRIRDWATRHAGVPELRVLEDAALAVSLHGLVQESLLRRLLSALGDRPFVLLKGAAVRRLAYEAPELRGGWDTDVGARLDTLPAVEEVARELGFVPVVRRGPGGLTPVSRLQRAFQEVGHYELVTMVREQVVDDLEPEEEAAVRRALPALAVLAWGPGEDGTLRCRAALDLHHALVPGVGVEGALASRRPRGGAPVPSLAWALAHLALKLDHDPDPADAHVLLDLTHLWARAETEGELAAARRLAATLPAGPAVAALARGDRDAVAARLWEEGGR